MNLDRHIGRVCCRPAAMEFGHGGFGTKRPSGIPECARAKEKQAGGLFPPDMDEGIYVGFQARNTPAGDVLWDGVKSGRLTALSIVGNGTREEL